MSAWGFAAEEIVRDLAERGALNGAPGAYISRGDVGDVDVPATLQATIGARIDRLGAAAKQTLNAAAVIGSRFDAELLAGVVDSVDVAPLIKSDSSTRLNSDGVPSMHFVTR
jgi:adenylate cyclase